MARAGHVKVGPQGAAKGLDLDVIEHAIRLLGAGAGLLHSSSCSAISGSSRFGNLVLRARSNSHSVVARGNCTNIPLAAGRLERTGPFFVAAFEAMQSIGSSTRIGRG